MPRPSSPHRSRLILPLFLLLAVVITSLVVPLAAQTRSDKNSKASGEIVNVYSYRQPFLVEPLFEKFTQTTGIGVRMIFAKKGLIERVETEGKNVNIDSDD